jgi:hemerythrin
MAIVWRQQMSIDDGTIDDDHKYLIGLVNDVDAVPPGPGMPAELAVILARLETYARIHFQREERLQVAVAFTYQLAHHRRHKVLLRELNAMRPECETIHLPEQWLAFHARLCEFLYRWLVDHILKVDVLMKPFVSGMKQHAETVSSLAEAVRLSAASRESERAAAYGQMRTVPQDTVLPA